MKRRIFIAINLPENIKNQLADLQKKIDGLFEPPSPIRWTKKENLHITSVFLGYLADEELLEVCRIAKETALKHKSFFIDFKKVLYGPPKKPPRMIWAEGEKNAELGELQKGLESSLTATTARYETETRPYTPHITLGRINMWEFRQIEPEERPDVSQDINLSFEVKSIEVMESLLKKAGPDYTILESCPLKN